MPRYRVAASADAIMRASLYVDADTPEEAEVTAKEFFESGEPIWNYDGVLDDTIEVERATLA
jgi:hypothetical protein